MKEIRDYTLDIATEGTNSMLKNENKQTNKRIDSDIVSLIQDSSTTRRMGFPEFDL